MINIDDIKAGYTLGHADAEILRGMVKELSSLQPCQHHWNTLRLTEGSGRYQYCTLCGEKKVAE